MAMAFAGFKSKFPWTDASRLQLVETVRALRESKSQNFKWREVAGTLTNDMDLDETMFSKLCAKQFDNLFRAYTKFKQDGLQPPRLTSAIISEFEAIYPPLVGVGKASDGSASASEGLAETKSSSPEPTKGKVKGSRVDQINWTNITRINLLTAIRVTATKEGKIHWQEVVACMPNDFGMPIDRLCTLCMEQFTDLGSTYKMYRMAGRRDRYLTIEVMENLDELYRNFPNLNPVPVEGEAVLRGEMEDFSKDNTLGGQARSEHSLAASELSPPASEYDFDCRSSPRNEVFQTIVSAYEPSSASEAAAAPAPEPARASTPCPVPPSPPPPVPTPEPVPERTPCSAPAPALNREGTPCSAPAPALNREGDETSRAATKDGAHLGKRKERAEASSSQTDMSTPEDQKDDQEVGFDRMERELQQLNSWMKQKVHPVGKEVLTRVKAYGRRNQLGKKSKYDPHDDFDKLIYEASQKSTILFIRAQFQQTRANILKEVKDTIERVGMDLLHRRTNHGFSKDGTL